MKFKFNRRKIEYIVKPEERIVIGWISTIDGMTGIIEELDKYKMGWVLPAINVEDIWEQDNRIIKAVSRCDESDEFDEKIGKKIVADILEKKYHSIMIKKYRKCEEKILQMLSGIYGKGIEHNARLKELQSRIDSYKD